VTTPLIETIAKGTPLVIPIPDGPYTSQRLTLDGRVYTLYLDWNQWAATWYMHLADVEDEPIVCGIRLVTNWPLLRFYKYEPRMPPGEMIAHDLTGDGSPPGLNDFGEGKRVELTYYAQTIG
jgi:hypothetical protein